MHRLIAWQRYNSLESSESCPVQCNETRYGFHTPIGLKGEQFILLRVSVAWLFLFKVGLAVLTCSAPIF